MASESGLKGGLEASTPILMLIAGFTAIAWYNVVELNLLIYFRFKRHRGLYFWSLVISSWGVALHALSFLAKFFQVWRNDIVSVTFICLGWYCMVTGQSLVLYSRLHLVAKRRLRWVLVMIIVNAILLHGGTTVLVFGANSALSDKFLFPYSVMEKIQVTAFAIQETIISSLYIYHTYRLLHPTSLFPHASTRKIMHHLVRVNILIIIMDLTLLGTEFANHYQIQTTLKSTLYSIKLKLEFAILNQLVELTRGNLRRKGLGGSNAGLDKTNLQRDVGGKSKGPRTGDWDDSFTTNSYGESGRRSEGQGIESPQQTYFVSSTSCPQRSDYNAGRVRSFYSSCSSNNIVTTARGSVEGWKYENPGTMSVLKTVDVDITVEKDEDAVFGLGKWRECEKESGGGVGSGPSLSDIECEMRFVTGKAFLEDIIEVHTPTSPCPPDEKRMRNFP